MVSRTLSRTSSKPRKPPLSQHPPYLIVTATDTAQKSIRAKPHFPTEILDEIVEIVLQNAGNSLLFRFGAIWSLSCSSQRLRQISLRLFLRVLDFGNEDPEACWSGVCNIMQKETCRTDGKGGFAYVESLTSVSSSMILEPYSLGSFLNLRTLAIDLARQGLGTQHNFFKHIFRDLFASPMRSLKQLSLNSVPRVDCSLLKFIAQCFPCLEKLRISTTERLKPLSSDCPCWYCLDEILSLTFHSPIPDMFTTVEQMAQAYATALSPLSTSLTHLHLGIYLSDEDALYKHAPHDIQYFGIFSELPMKCDVCEERIGKDVRMRKLLASTVMAQRLEKLESISWGSLLVLASPHCDGDCDMPKSSGQTEKLPFRKDVPLDGQSLLNADLPAVFRNFKV
ncbi:hypothetical protein D9758_008735 [Tetrapyrgos nigripes]|uniref:Uncharacterized protein n=1 Tax=Tetrapyrgos nigripes TaxID=182062 RepID=A0A8H5D3U8_9AGAR|nr:hypothetical protein D9758_008735 [Tetrapyrgos nigripes]